MKIRKPLLFSLALLVIMVVINLSTFKVSGYFNETGYVVTTDLKNEIIDDNEKTKLEYVTPNDEIFSRIDGTYTKDAKIKFYDEYPMFLQDGQSVLFFNENSSLISNEFTVLPTYNGLYLANGTTYNSDKSKADYDEFIFVKLSTGVYIFAQPAKVETVFGTYAIKSNSVALLGEDTINYAEFKNGYLNSNNISALNDATITIGNNKYNYNELYAILNEVKTSNKDENQIIDIIQEKEQPSLIPSPSIDTQLPKETQSTAPNNKPNETSTPKTSSQPSKDKENQGGSDAGGTFIPNDFVKPVVTIDNVVEPWVYTVSGKLSITDDSKSLYRGVQVYIRYANSDRLYMRKTVKESGDFTIGILQPDTEFDLTVAYKYRLPNRQKIDVVVNETPITFKTLSRNQLEPLKFTMKEENPNTKIYFTSQTSVEGMKFDSSVDGKPNKTTNYVSRAIFNFIDEDSKTINLSLNPTLLKQLTTGREVTWLTNTSLQSNSKYTYHVTFYDSFNEPLPMSNDSILEGTTKTAKKLPKATFTITSTSVGNVKLRINVENVDAAQVGKTVFYLTELNDNKKIYLNYSLNGSLHSNDEGVLEMGSNDIAITNLPSGGTYALHVETDTIDIGDNQVHQNVKLLHEYFYTDSLSTLGKAYFDLKITDTKSQSASLNLKISSRVNKILLKLISDFNFKVFTNNNAVYEINFKRESLNHEINLNSVYYENMQYNYDLVDNDKYKVVLYAEDSESLKNPWTVILDSADTTKKSGISIIFKEQSLQSKTDYTFNIAANALQGGIVTNVTAVSDYPVLKTLKKAPVVTIENQFTTSNFQEIYDFKISDPDNAVLGEQLISMRLYDGQTMIYSKAIKANQLYDKHRFNNLEKGKEYNIEFIAVEYNEGYTANTLQTYKRLAKFTFITGDNITGEIKIVGTEQTFLNVPEEAGEINLAKVAINEGTIYPDKSRIANSFTDLKGSTSFRISVEEGQEYRVLNFNRVKGQSSAVYFTDSDDKNITAISINSFDDKSNNSSASVTIPTRAKYMYININSDFDDLLTVYKHNPAYCEESTELFTTKNETVGKYLQANNVLNSSPTYNTTDFIPVTGGNYYDFSSTMSTRLAFYDKNGNYIYFSLMNNVKYTILTPINAAYIRITYQVSDKQENSLKLCLETNKNRLDAKVNIKLDDKKNDLIENPYYYIQMYRTILENEDNHDKYQKYGEPIKYDITVSNNSVESVDRVIRIKDLPANYAYSAELIVHKYNTDVSLGYTYFNTEKIISSIYDEGDFAKILIDPSANFNVYSDIELTGRILTTNSSLAGVLDFNGHKITTRQYGVPILPYVGKTGVVKNFEYDVYYDQGIMNFSYYPLISVNNGEVTDFVFNINLTTLESNDDSYFEVFGGIANENSGTIKNFFVNNKNEFNVLSLAFVTYSNRGTIKNGWLYGEPVRQVIYGEYNDITNSYPIRQIYYKGLIAGLNSGAISNIFSQVDLTTGDYYYNTNINDGRVLSFFTTLQRGVFKDSAVYSDYYIYNPTLPEGYQEKLINDQYNIFRETSNGRETSNIVSFSPKLLSTIQSDIIKKGDLELLWDYRWYDANFNSSQGFNTLDLVTAGYYPHVKMNAVMDGKQPFVFLPDYLMIEQDMYFSYVEDQKINEATLVLTVNNDNNYKVESVNIEGLDTTVVDQYWDQGNYRVRVKVSNPTMFYSKYSLKSIESSNASGNRIITKYEVNSKFGVKFVEPEFYDSISNANEWSKLRANPKQNYRLVNDIDFTGFTDFQNQIYVRDVFTGKLDGAKFNDNEEVVGYYSLKNIKSSGTNGVLFSKVTGRISNLIIDNYTSNDNINKVAAIIDSIDNAKLNNIHIRNSNFTSALRSGVVNNAVRSVIENSSIVDCNFSLKESPTSFDSQYVGSFIANSTSGVTIKNSYVYNTNIDAFDGKVVAGVGGFIGSASYTTVENSYFVGTIYGLGSSVGGILGLARDQTVVSNCWTDADILTTGSYAAQIATFTSSGFSSKNNVVLGNVNSKYSSADGLRRILSPADNAISASNNYAYEYQLIGGQILTDSLDANFLSSTEQLSSVDYWMNQIQIGDYFDLVGGKSDLLNTTSKSVTEGYLPMVIGTDGNLVYGQKQYPLTIKMEYSINQISFDKNTRKFTVNLTIHHSNYELLDGLAMSGAKNLEFKTNKLNDSETVVEIKGEITNSWDSYSLLVPTKNIITGITSKSIIQISFGDPIFYQIDSREAWNAFMASHKDSYENIEIVGDIDFKGYDKDKDITKVKINRLKGQSKLDGTKYKICNIDYKVSQNYESIFQTIVEIENLEFNNISYDGLNKANSQSGLFNEVYGKIQNVDFKNISMKLGSGSYIGMIGTFSGSELKNITIEGINIENTNYSNSYVGALAGQITKTIDIDNIKIIGEKTTDNFGNDVYTNNILLPSNGTSSGANQVSGVFGISTIQQPNLKNIEVSGLKIVAMNNVHAISYGGNVNQSIRGVVIKDCYFKALNGMAYGIVQNSTIYEATIENTKIEGLTNAVGIGNGSVYNSVIRNSKIVSENGEASGIGSNNSSLNNIVDNCEIIAEDKLNTGNAYAGGIKGNRADVNHYSVQGNKIINTKITGNGDYVGGLYGFFGAGSQTLDNTVYNCEINGRNHVGGLVGYNRTDRQYFRNYVENTSIKGNRYVGGLIGYANLAIVYNNYVGSGVNITATEQGAGGIFGYNNYINTQITTVSYSKMYGNIVGANVEASSFAGGLIGIYNVGASIANWPKNSSGNNLGTPTEGFSGVDYKSNVFTGNVRSTNFGNFFANLSNGLDVKGMERSAVYENAKLTIASSTLLAKDSDKFVDYTEANPIDIKNITRVSTKELESLDFYTNEIVGLTNLQISSEEVSGFDLNEMTVERTKDGIYIKNINSTGNQTVSLLANQITANSYVTDGLVTWYDGINNQGFNTPHNRDALVWKNLVSSQDATLHVANKPLTSTSPKIYFDDNSLKFTVADNAVFAKAENVSNLFSNGKYKYTFEFCFDSPYTTSGYGALMTIDDAVIQEAMGFGRGSNGRIFYNGTDFIYGGGTIVNQNDDFTLSFSSTYPTTMSKSKKIHSNGLNIATSTTADGNCKLDVFKIGISSWNSLANRNFYSIRVYNRDLSDREIAHNAKVDELFYKKYLNIVPAQKEVIKAIDSNAIFVSNDELNGLGDIKVLEVQVGNQSVIVDYNDLKPSNLELIDDKSVLINSLTPYTSALLLKPKNASGVVTWYRVNKNYFKAVPLQTVQADQFVRVEGYGRYYCEDSTGNRSQIVTMNMPKYLPYLSNNGIVIEGMEGADKDGNIYPTNDKWYSGGFILPGYEAYIEASGLIKGNSGKARSTGISVEKAMDQYGFKLYASDVDKVNIEFADLAKYGVEDFFVIEENGIPVITSKIDKNIYSFTYDFKSNIAMKLSLNGEVIPIAIDVNEIRRDIMTYGSHYYYLHPTGIGTDTGTIEGSYLHLMNGKALSSTGEIIDCDTKAIIASVEQIMLVNDQPLFSTIYQDQILETYKTFTRIISKDGISVNSKLVLSRNNELISLMSDDVVIYDSFIRDKIDGDEYYGILTKNGKWIDILKTMIMPDEVEKTNIRNTTYNLYTTSPIILMRYESGEVKGFNYKTGELFELIQPLKIDVSFLTYISNVFENTFSPANIYAADYNSAVAFDELIDSNAEAKYELENFDKTGDPILKIAPQQEDNEKYEKEFSTVTEGQLAEVKKNSQKSILVYNEEKDKFESFDVQDILEKKNPISNEEKVEELKNQGKLINLERGNSRDSYSMISPMKILEYVMIVTIILAGYLIVTKLKRHR